MDRSFYEFWGRYFLALGRGGQPFEDVAAWMRQGFRGYEEISEAVRKAYGVDRGEDPDAAADLWKKTCDSFLASFREYMAVFQVVPREDLEKLERENRELREQIARLEETALRQQALLADKGLDPSAMIDGFQELMLKQTDEFQKLMESAGRYFDEKKSRRSP